MEMITLLKANIRHKKGSVMSVIFLTIIVAVSVATVLCINEGSKQGILKAHEIADTPNIRVMYIADKLTGRLVEAVQDNPLVAETAVYDFLICSKTVMDGREYTNSTMLMEAPENAKLLEDDISGIAGDAPSLGEGEVYVSQGLLTNMDGKVGESVTVETLAGDYTFIVKGIFLEPMTGASVIGWKTIYVSSEDYAEMESAIAQQETDEEHAIGKGLDIYKASTCELSDAAFRRQLNIDTGFSNMGIGSITKEMSVYYTELFQQIVSSILMVFVVLLLGIVLIVVVHSISMEIESNYMTFGILKAQGFGTDKLRVLFLLQYLIAEIFGSVLGIACSVPVIMVTANIYAPVTAIPAVLSVPVIPILLILLSMFLLAVVSILLVTGRLNAISPFRAISGVKTERYFDSRMNVPISGKFLSASLAFRQFTAAKRRYISAFAIVTILVFFMMTISILANTVTSKSALDSMGAMVSEINISPKKQITDEEFADMEKVIGRFSKIEKRYYYTNRYFSFEGEEIMGMVCKNPDVLPAWKGRVPIYDNEIAVSQGLLDEFGLAIGDEVRLAFEDREENYLISGTVQMMNDAGRCFLISEGGAKRLNQNWWLWGCYSLEDDKDREKIIEALNEQFGDIMEARAEDSLLDDAYQVAIDSMQLIIYAFSVVFSLVVVQMVCSKALIGEQKDIGIYKALGFTPVRLRLLFAIRFFIVAVLGSVLASGLCYALSGKMLSVLLYRIGVPHFVVQFDIRTFAVPVVVICTSFFVFSYFAAGKVKRVRVRELIAE